ncbi:magnesium transporter [Vibrio sinaloensis]|uniref:magnesium transporter n=1 Tax=Photobacterium sp. (strain ATCC 43367) TaxID=379097 RepID=UPI002F41CA6A
MSSTPSKTLRSNGIDSKLTRIAKTVFSYSIKLTGAIAILLSASVLLSKLGTIHGKELPEEYFSNGYPAILTLLDSEVFMGFIFFITVAILVYVVYLMWQLHEVAVHRAAKMSSAHTQIVFALSLCGLFIDKTWWVLAIIIAFARWDVLAAELSNIIRNGRQSNKATEE